MAYLWKYARFFVSSSLLTAFLHLRRPYKLIHVTSPPDFMVFASILPKLLGSKVILDVHDIMPEFFARKLGYNLQHWTIKVLKLLEKLSAKYSDHVITVTDIWRNTLINRSIAEHKCSVLLNVPDTNIFNRRNKIKRKKDKKFRILYPGNVDFGLDTLIKAMKIIGREIPSAELGIYGHGGSLEKLIQFSMRIGTNRFINFNKSVPAKDLARIMQEVDVGVDPMQDGVFFEDVLTVKSLEFLSMGVPLVVSRRKASEYYFDDSMVEFFEAGNHKDLARAIIDLYESSDRRAELVKNARTFAKIHNWKKYKETYLGIVSSLCLKS